MALVRKPRLSKPSRPAPDEFAEDEAVRQSDKAAAESVKELQESARVKNKLDQMMLSVRFTTKIAAEQLHLSDAVYNLPAQLNSTSLSKVVAHLLREKNEKIDDDLSLSEEEKSARKVPDLVLDRLSFDFVLQNAIIRDSIADHLATHKISAERNLLIEYIDRIQEPSDETVNEHPDWVSSVDVLGRGTVHMWDASSQSESMSSSDDSTLVANKDRFLAITGCYDGVIRVWSVSNTAHRPPFSDPFSQSSESKEEVKFQDESYVLTSLRCHLAPIKAVSSLYSTEQAHYFATSAMDATVKVFEMQRSNRQIRQIGQCSKTHHKRGVTAMSAPSPSRVFCTAGIDSVINVFRMPAHMNDDDNESMMDLEQITEQSSLKDSTGLLSRKRRRTMMMSSDSIRSSSSITTDEELTLDSSLSEKHSRAKLDSVCSLRAHTDRVSSLDWVNPYAMYSGSYDGTMKLWDLTKEVDAFTWACRSAVSSLKFWHDQNLLISAHSNRKICVWDPRTDQAVVTRSAMATYRSHRLNITGLACNSRTRRPLFVTGSHDGKLKYWDLRSNKPLFENRKHNGKVLCVDWCADTVLSGGSDNRLHCYHWKVQSEKHDLSS